jgi:hypothetical protein
MTRCPGEIEPATIFGRAPVTLSNAHLDRSRASLAVEHAQRALLDREGDIRDGTDSRITREVMFVEVGNQRFWHGSEAQAEPEYARPRVRGRRSDDHRLSFTQLAG